MTIILTEDQNIRGQLLPITYTRPVAAIRTGIFTMQERWQQFIDGDYYYKTEEYLTELFPSTENTDDMTLYLAGHVFATAELANAVVWLKSGQVLIKDGIEIARRGNNITEKIEWTGNLLSLQHVYDIFTLNGEVLTADYHTLTSGRQSQPIPSTCTVIGDTSLLFIEEGAQIDCCSLNLREGPIYIGHDAVVMEGSHLRGPIAILNHAQVNMGTRIYGATTLGPYCKVGGELNNVVMLGYSNKGHDGFLGNAVIGEWCNLGGGTVASNLKNDYSEIKLWNYPSGRFLRTGLQFCGLIMGDHSKSAVNTSFNTATTIGVGCNIISEGMPRVFIPSFSRGGTAGFDNVHLSEFFTIARRVMARRDCELTKAHEHMFEYISEYADNFK